MGALIGRELELRRASDALSSALEHRTLRVVRIAGISGVGKSALLETVLDGASPSWLSVPIAVNQIQQGIPLSAARRILAALVAKTGNDAEKYGASLAAEAGAQFDETFLRVIEGVTLDHPLLLALDDAQWCDPESMTLIERTLAALNDRSIGLVTTERLDETSAAFTVADVSIALGPLSNADARALVRTYLPSTGERVIDAIVAYGKGNPIDLIALASAASKQDLNDDASADASVRRLIASELMALPAPVREFLQTCALIIEPIDYMLLSRLWNDDELQRFLGLASGRYLIRDSDGLRFIHAAVAQSIRETIAIDIPIRKRIIAALESSEPLRYEDYEQLVEQYLAIGDRENAARCAFALSDAAVAEHEMTLAAQSLERALTLTTPSVDRAIPAYTKLSVLYNSLSREFDTARVCEAGLAFAAANGIEQGIGGLVTSLLLAQWHAMDRNVYGETFERYDARLTSPDDRRQLASVALFAAMNKMDLLAFERYREELVLEPLPPMLRLRLLAADTFKASRTGDVVAAQRTLREAYDAVSALPPNTKIMPMALEAFHTFSSGGVGAAEALLARLPATQFEVLRYIQCLCATARGELDDVRVLVQEALVRGASTFGGRLLIGLEATAAALNDDFSPYRREIVRNLQEYRAGIVHRAHVPILSACALRETRVSGAFAELRKTAQLYHDWPDASVFTFPVVHVIAAINVNDREVLEAFASEAFIVSDKRPWNVAQKALARGVAARALHRREGVALLQEAKSAFEAFDAPVFAQLAGRFAGQTEREKKSTHAGTTRREREIAALVAEGMTNKEIAQKLVLSERTVEGHIANLFAKVNVGSRTQLAAWFLRNVSSVA